MKTVLRLFVVVAAAALILFARRFNFSLEEWSNIAEITSAILAVVLGWPALTSFIRSNREKEEAFRRERVLATLPDLNLRIDQADKLRQEIDKVFNKKNKRVLLDPDNPILKDSAQQSQLESDIGTFLNYWDNIGLAMNITPEVYDIETFADRMGKKTLRTWDRFSREMARRKANNPNNTKMFLEFDELNIKLIDLYNRRGDPYVSEFTD